MDPIFLTVEEVVYLHDEQIELYGGSPGLRDEGALVSAVEMPAMGIGETLFHEDMAAMAGAYLFHLAQNHPFVDGNKRTGLHAALVFLDMNGYRLESPEDELERMVLMVAASKMSKEDAATYIREHLFPLTSG